MPLHPGQPPSPPPSAASTCRTAFSPSLPAGGRRRGGRLRDPSRAPAGTPASPAARTGSLTSTGSGTVQDARRLGPPPSSTPPDPRRPRTGCRASAEGRRQPGTVVRPAPPAVVAAGPKSLPLGCRHPEPRRKPPGLAPLRFGQPPCCTRLGVDCLRQGYTAPLSALPGERVAGAFPSLVSVLRAWADSPTPLLPLAKLLAIGAVQVVCPHLLGVAAPSGVRVRSAACASSCECGECRTPNHRRHCPLPASPSRNIHSPTRHSRWGSCSTPPVTWRSGSPLCCVWAARG